MKFYIFECEGADIEATRDVTCNVDGDILGDEVLQAYHVSESYKKLFI